MKWVRSVNELTFGVGLGDGLGARLGVGDDVGAGVT